MKSLIGDGNDVLNGKTFDLAIFSSLDVAIAVLEIKLRTATRRGLTVH